MLNLAPSIRAALANFSVKFAKLMEKIAKEFKKCWVCKISNQFGISS